MHRSTLAFLILATVAVPSFADELKDHVMFKAADLKWSAGPGSLPPGAQVAVLEGNPADEGIFTIRLKLPADYRISPHWHPAWEHITVIDGAFWMGRGEKFDEAVLHEIPAGGFGAMAPGTRHFAMTKASTTIQLHGMGPWQLYYVNASDDPRTKK
jgi:hypothetical protein